MTVAAYKPPGNFRPSPKHLPIEGFTVLGAVGVLAEAPADPGSFPIFVTVGGNTRTRVTASPAPGEYRILQQTVPGFGTEFLPVLEFNPTDEGLTGTCDYFGVGTVITSQFFAMLVNFLTPLTGFDAPELLPQPTTDQTMRGRSGDVAFMSDGSGYFSDGTTWNPFGVGGVLKGKLTISEAMALAVDSGYVGPSLSDSVALPAMLGAMSFNGIFDMPDQGTTFLAYVFGVSTDAVKGDLGALTLSEVLALPIDAVIGLYDSFTPASTLALTSDGAWAGPPGAPTYVASGTAGFAGWGGGYAVAPPAGIQNNDLLILIVEADSMLTFSGWTKFSPASVNPQMFWKRTTGTEASVSVPTQGGPSVGQMHAFRSCSVVTTPVDACWTTFGTLGAPSITTVTPNDIVVLYTTANNYAPGVGAFAPAVPTGVTGVATTQISTASANNIGGDDQGYTYFGLRVTLFSGIAVAAGPTGASSYTQAQNNGSFGYLFALKPLP